MNAVLLLVLLAPGDVDQRARDFGDRVHFERADPDCDEARKVVDILSSKEHWIAAHKALEQKLGPMPDNLSVTVDFALEGADVGWGGNGRVRFNLKLLTEMQKKMNDLERQRKEAAARGQRVVFRVPPVRIERVIDHELTHLFQRGTPAPGWFVEGMAQWISEDVNNLMGFANAGKPVQPIDAETTDRNDAYARGHVFFKWLESRGAVQRTADRCILQQKPWKDALQDATAMSWTEIVKAEQEWSAKEVDRLLPKDPKRR